MPPKERGAQPALAQCRARLMSSVSSWLAGTFFQRSLCLEQS